MARAVNRLSARGVATATRPGRHADGNGLYLVVDPSGARRWLFLFRWGGKLKELGLGGTAAVSLADARLKASEARKLLDAGRNPIEVKRRPKTVDPDRPKTFGELVDKLVPDIVAGFRNEKHKAQWRTTLDQHAASLRPLLIEDVGTEHVLDVLKPIWLTKAETASRLRGRIEHVLAAAAVVGYRTGENPARWRNHLDKLLPKKARLQRGHHPAMPYGDVPAFVRSIRDRDAVAARALEFMILTASRTGEVRGAEWDEFDLAAKVWTVPAKRMKNGKPHRVPLSDRAVTLIEKQREEAVQGEFAFAGAKPGRPLSSHAILMLMRRLQMEHFTPHGFRSSFRDWADESTSFPRQIVEMSLSHTVGDETELAYRRNDALEKRRKLMEAWAKFLGTAKAKPASNVTPIGAARAS